MTPEEQKRYLDDIRQIALKNRVWNFVISISTVVLLTILVFSYKPAVRVIIPAFMIHDAVAKYDKEQNKQMRELVEDYKNNMKLICLQDSFLLLQTKRNFSVIQKVSNKLHIK